MPIITGWELAATASGSPALRRTVVSWKQPLAEGSTPSELVSGARVFPELFASLYHTGEVTGQLDETLKRLHVLYQDEGSRKLRAVAQWSPRLFYFGILGVVGWKIVSYYTGYFAEINRAINF